MKIKKVSALLCALSIMLSLSVFAAPIDATTAPPPEINAKGAIIGEANGGTVLFEKDADVQLYPASTTKLMTALVAVDHLKLDEIITVSQKSVEGLSEEGSNVFLMAGEQMVAVDMLNYLLIPSGNDGANAIAEHISGSNSEFAKLMNEKAKSLGCKNTNFVNPHGLHDENHYTSARDLYLIACEAMKNPVIKEIVAKEQYTLPATNMHPKETTITSTNLLISRIKDARYYYKGANGIKTGTTTPAGFCLIGGMESGDLQYISVVLGASKNPQTGDIGCYTETIKLFNYAKNNFSSQVLAAKDAPIKEAEVRFSSGASTVVLVPSKDFTALVPKNADLATVNYTTSVHDPIDAPIAKGDVLGTATIDIGGTVYGDIELVASSSIERSTFKFVLHKIEMFLKSTTFKIILAAILALVLILVIMRITNKRKRRTRYRGKRR